MVRKRRLFLPLYLWVTVGLVLGGSFVAVFEGFAAADFSRIVVFLEDNRELIGAAAVAETEAEEARIGAEIERRIYSGNGPEVFPGLKERRPETPIFGLIVIHYVLLAAWLWPVYRRNPNVSATRQVESRVIRLPLIVLALPWVIGAINLAIRLGAAGPASPTPENASSILFIVSYILFGALVSQFNVSVTLPYITGKLADHVFTHDDRYRMKRGGTISIAGRVRVLILVVGLLPIVLIVATPILFNWWFFVAETTSTEPDFVRLAQLAIPIAVMVLISVYFIVGQLIALGSFRHAIQRPIDTLIERMRTVASGDFSVRSSVLSADEIGALKGHFNTMVEGLEEREKIRDTFGRYVSMEIAEKLIHSGTVDLDGEEIETTVMFADIRNFTALSERMAPRELVTFLNEYFSYIVEPISQNRGVVNKFIGDSVMAVFSPVFGVQAHAAAAVRAGLGMRSALVAFNRSEKWKPIRQGIGVHTGVLIAGTVGAKSRREYTVIGDTVNVASRIESQTKVLGTDLLVSGDCVDHLDAQATREFRLAETEPVTMRGKTQPTRLFIAE